MRVARAPGPSAEDNADQPHAGALHGRHQIETGRVDIARLDAVGAGIIGKKLVVVAETLPLPAEGFRSEESEELREIAANGDGEPRHVAGRRALLAVRQAGGVAEGRPRHAERPRLAGHALAELALGLRQPLGDDRRNVVGRFRDQRVDGVLHGNALARLEIELRGRAACRHARYLQARRHRNPAGLEILEKQIQGHDLGQRRRDSAPCRRCARTAPGRTIPRSRWRHISMPAPNVREASPAPRQTAEPSSGTTDGGTGVGKESGPATGIDAGPQELSRCAVSSKAPALTFGVPHA